MKIYSDNCKRAQDENKDFRTSYLLRAFWTILWILVISSQFLHCQCATYEEGFSLSEAKLNNKNYSKDMRPIKNQSDTFEIAFEFSLVSIVEVNDVSQSITVNFFMLVLWVDELMAWNPDDYGGIDDFSAKVENIWRPAILLTNAVDDKDIFKETESTFFMHSDGTVYWSPGLIVTTSCSLDMTQFPFDEQTCTLHFLSVAYDLDDLSFKALAAEVTKDPMYSENSEWELIATFVEADSIMYQNNYEVPTVKATLKLKRRPISLMLGMVCPVVFLSFLNILVFLVPVKSGEKITYGITVLLALAVFMTIVSGLLPKSSVNLPSLTTYIFILLILAVISVVISIGVVGLNSMDEEQTSIVAPKTQMKSDVDPMDPNTEPPFLKEAWQKGKAGATTNENRWKLLSKRINKVSFIVLFVAWTGLTIGYLSYLAS